jgi:hypothetical protein
MLCPQYKIFVITRRNFVSASKMWQFSNIWKDSKKRTFFHEEIEKRMDSGTPCCHAV